MTTTEHLATLNYDQLRFARDKADAMIRTMESSPLIDVWRIENNTTILNIYPASQYELAAKKLIALAENNVTRMSESAWVAHNGRRRLELHLSLKSMTEAEYLDWQNTHTSKLNN